MDFFAEPDLKKDLCEQIAKLAPTNPFYTWPYLQAMKSQEPRIWALALGLADEGKVVSGCVAFVRAGRLNRLLEITSLPEIPDADAFWSGLSALCGQIRISRLQIRTYASLHSKIPDLSGELRRSIRREYVLDLRNVDLFEKLHLNHKRRIKRARAAGVQIVTTKGDGACEEHTRVMAESMKRRRERGESVSTIVNSVTHSYLMADGPGELFQAMRGNRVLSSILVLKADLGGYYHSGGCTPEGMDCGAAHLLHHEVSKIFQRRSMEVYNLGGAGQSETGLADFKARFSTSVRALESAEFFVGGLFRKSLFICSDGVEKFKKQLLAS